MDAVVGTGKISKRQYEIFPQLDNYVTMSDGVKVNLDIFQPDGEGKFPALVGLSPLNLEFQRDRVWPSAVRSQRVRGTPTTNIESGPTEFFVRRGYVHVIGSTRGTGKSEGTYQYMSPREVQDIYEVVEWAAEQPWCNGNVGLIGIAYFAALQPQVAALQPPHLKAIAPMFAFWDDYRYFWWDGGILANGFLKWVNSLVNVDVHTEKSVLLEELGEEGFREAVTRALGNKDICADPGLVEALKNPNAPGNSAILDILLHSTMCSYWHHRGSEIGLDKIKAPAYFGAVSHRPGVLYHWSDLKMPKTVVWGPPAYVDRPFYQYSWELLRWYDHWLKGLDNGIQDDPPVKIFVAGAEEWLMANDFPIPGTKWIPFALHENRSLCEIEPWPEAASASYDDAPNNRGSLNYHSPPMVENTEMVGLASLNLYASCRGTDMNLFASLYDVDPAGKETCLTRGYLKASHRELDLEKSRPYHPVHTHTNPKPLVPGQVYEFSIGFQPMAFLFKAGHRFALKISSADDQPDNLHQVGMYHLCSQTPNTVTIYHNARYPSHLLLPITRGNIVGTYVSGGDISLTNKEFMKQE